jgi:GntR family transcriptional repressor for pyruvate dehydrogenase complex
MSIDLYKRFSRDQLYQRVASHVEELIVSGELNPGDKLPPEREWAQQMDVARGVVRESVKLLAERGLVDVVPGRGTFVAEFGAEPLLAQFDRSIKIAGVSQGELTEARYALEVAIAGCAAQRATASDLTNLERAIQEMDNNITAPQAFTEADLSFHRYMAEATQNKIFPLLIDVMVDSLRAVRYKIFQTPGAPDRGQMWHRRILEAIRLADAEGAREAMRRHLEQVTTESEAGDCGLIDLLPSREEIRVGDQIGQIG